jgi:hypothetical protein
VLRSRWRFPLFMRLGELVPEISLAASNALLPGPEADRARNAHHRRETAPPGVPGGLQHAGERVAVEWVAQL